MRCTKFYFQPELVRNQNLQLLCYVIFFDILHHYGVIAASQICSVSRKYCAVLRNRFFGFCFFRWAPGSGACACHMFLWWASSLASVLLFSVWLHYDLSVFFFLVSSLTRLVGLFRHSLFFGYPCFLSLAASAVLFFLSSFLCGLAAPPVA